MSESIGSILWNDIRNSYGSGWRICGPDYQSMIGLFFSFRSVKLCCNHFFVFVHLCLQHVHCHIMPRKAGDFEHNDQIYIELNKHDHPDASGTAQPPNRRSLEERTAEANAYRQILATFY